MLYHRSININGDNTMFIETDKNIKHNIFKAEYRVNPDNQKIKLLNPFDHISSDKISLTKEEYAFCRESIKNFPSFQNIVLSLYYHKKHSNIDLQKSIIISAVKLSEDELCTVCRIFSNAVFIEEYPIFDENKCICGSMQAVMVSGLTVVGCELAERIISENPLLFEIYNNPIANDINKTSFYRFEPDCEKNTDSRYSDYVNFLFSEEYFRLCGSINVSSLTYEKLQNHPICSEIAKRVNELYLLNYDLDFNGQKYYVKYLNWY